MGLPFRGPTNKPGWAENRSSRETFSYHALKIFGDHRKHHFVGKDEITVSAKFSVGFNFSDERAPKFFPTEIFCHQTFIASKFLATKKKRFLHCSFKNFHCHHKIPINITYCKCEKLSNFILLKCCRHSSSIAIVTRWHHHDGNQ